MMSRMQDNLHIIVDGRVYSTEAHDRGMGRYLTFILGLLHKKGYEITLLEYQNSHLKPDDDVHKFVDKLEKMAVDPNDLFAAGIHDFSVMLETKIKKLGADIYIDATPVVSPMRYDITICPVITIAYDLIPLRNPEHYFPNGTPNLINDIYKAALRSLLTSDGIIAISQFTADCVQRYVGISKEKINIIYPNLDVSYRTFSDHQEKRIVRDIISIVGHHHSKNPEFSLRFLNRLRKEQRFEVKIIVPTQTQYLSLQAHKYELLKGLPTGISIPESEKKTLFSQSGALLHSSFEEGFGIPMLESLFLNTRVIGLDMLMNREILANTSASHKIGYLISDIQYLDIDAIVAFVKRPYDQETYRAFDEVRSAFTHHWDIGAARILDDMIDMASKNHRQRTEVVASMATSLPGQFCGVSDYAKSIVAGAKAQIQVYTTDSEVRAMNNFPNLVLKSYKAFDLDRKNHGAHEGNRMIYHLAISERLWFGIELLRQYGKKGDVVIIHDHLYLFGIYSVLLNQNRLKDFLKDYFLDEDADLAKQIPVSRILDFNEFNALTREYKHCWLARTEATFIDHLTEKAEQNFTSPNTIPLTQMVNRKYVPIGIADCFKYSLHREAKKFRQSRKILQDDIIIGVFGSITSNKYLIECASRVAWIVKQNKRLGKTKEIYFMVCGVVHEEDVMAQMRHRFIEEDVFEYIIHLIPEDEGSFDALFCAADIVLCCRKQDRGQLSHIIPRAMSLGSCIMTNEDSGYTMIAPEATFDVETDFAEDIARYVHNPSLVQKQRKRNRQLFEQIYNADRMVATFLEN